jgi:hypothetical protein
MNVQEVGPLILSRVPLVITSAPKRREAMKSRSYMQLSHGTRVDSDLRHRDLRGHRERARVDDLHAAAGEVCRRHGGRREAEGIRDLTLGVRDVCGAFRGRLCRDRKLGTGDVRNRKARRYRYTYGTGRCRAQHQGYTRRQTSRSGSSWLGPPSGRGRASR